MFRFINRLILVLMVGSGQLSCPAPTWAEELTLPAAGSMVGLSKPFSPLLLKGMTVYADNPLKFDFILDSGQTGLSSQDPTLRQEADRLIKFFLTALTVPEDDIWVNLSPYENNRIIPKSLGATALGRQLLAEDYLLKQISASLLYPEKGLGQEFWQKVYAKAGQQAGTQEFPINTFNKIWIMPAQADVYEQGQTVVIAKAHLTVMLEEDYLALAKTKDYRPQTKDLKRIRQPGDMFPTEQQNASTSRLPSEHPLNVKANPGDNVVRTPLAQNIIRDIIIPVLEKEVNEGKNFAPLRQIYNALILAAWYKTTVKDALLNQVYGNKTKLGSLKVHSIKDDPKEIYAQYLKAYKKGVFNYIKEEPQNVSVLNTAVPGKTLARKFFSGGFTGKIPLGRVAQLDQSSAMTGQSLKARIEISPFAGDNAMVEDDGIIYNEAYRDIAQWGTNVIAGANDPQSKFYKYDRAFDKIARMFENALGAELDFIMNEMVRLDMNLQEYFSPGYLTKVRLERRVDDIPEAERWRIFKDEVKGNTDFYKGMVIKYAQMTDVSKRLPIQTIIALVKTAVKRGFLGSDTEKDALRYYDTYPLDSDSRFEEILSDDPSKVVSEIADIRREPVKVYAQQNGYGRKYPYSINQELLGGKIQKGFDPSYGLSLTFKGSSSREIVIRVVRRKEGPPRLHVGLKDPSLTLSEKREEIKKIANSLLAQFNNPVSSKSKNLAMITRQGGEGQEERLLTQRQGNRSKNPSVRQEETSEGSEDYRTYITQFGFLSLKDRARLLRKIKTEVSRSTQIECFSNDFLAKIAQADEDLWHDFVARVIHIEREFYARLKTKLIHGKLRFERSRIAQVVALSELAREQGKPVDLTATIIDEKLLDGVVYFLVQGPRDLRDQVMRILKVRSGPTALLGWSTDGEEINIEEQREEKIDLSKGIRIVLANGDVNVSLKKETDDFGRRIDVLTIRVDLWNKGVKEKEDIASEILEVFHKRALDSHRQGGIDFRRQSLPLRVMGQGPGVVTRFDERMIARFRQGDFAGVSARIIAIEPVVLSQILKMTGS